MFFTQSLISPQRKKQPHNLLERVLSKPQKGLEELRQYVRVRYQEKQYTQIESISNYIIFRTTHQVKTQTRIILIQCLELIILQIKDVQSAELHSYISQMIILILNYFKDLSQKVRFQAINSIFNLISFYNTSYLPIFTQTFSSILNLISDQSAEIKIVVFHLNHCLKRLLNTLISADQFFDVNQFMAMLIQNFITQDSSPELKEFLIDWLIAIDQIPQFQISFYLPLVFKELFKLMEGQNEGLRDKSQECLKNFLSGFKELLRSRTRINKKIREDSFSMLMSVMLEVIKQSLNPKIKYHSLEWLEVFTQLFYNQLIKKEQVEVRRSFRSEFLLKQMKQPKNPQRTSKILSFIRQEMTEGDEQIISESVNLMNSDFFPNSKQKQKIQLEEIIQEELVEDDILYQEIPVNKAVTSFTKTTEFLVEIFLSFYDKIIILVMHSFSDETQKIRKITISINGILLESFPIVQEKAKILKSDTPVHTIITSQSQSYLQKLEIPLIIKLGKFLKESRTSHKIEAIIKWIKILYEKGSNPQLNLQISSLIQKIVQKICEKPVMNSLAFNHQISMSSRPPFSQQNINNSVSFNFNKNLFNLLADSIFMQKYLDLFIETLLSYFYQNQGIDFQRILIDIISMKVKYEGQVQSNFNQIHSFEKQPNSQYAIDSTQLIYITILKRLMLFQAQKGRFKQKMIQNMISILITQKSLSNLRKKLRSTSIRSKYLLKPNLRQQQPLRQSFKQTHILELIHQLFEYFCLNEGFTIIFCFLTGMYSLINKILKHIAEQNLLDRSRVKAFIKASNLLECYNLNHCKMDVLKSPEAIKSYLGFLMVIPPSKLNKVLMNRFPEDFVLEFEEDDRQSEDYSFENKLFDCYLKIIQKHYEELILIKKLEEERKQREISATMTFEWTKEFTKQFRKQQKLKQKKSRSILKPTSSKILKQSESEKNIKSVSNQNLLQSSQSLKLIILNSARVQQTFTVSPSERQLNEGQDERMMSQSYQEGYALSDESLQFGGSQVGNMRRDRGASEDMVMVEEPIKKKRQSKVKVVDMRIQ